METTRKTLINGRLAKVRRGLDEILDRVTPDMMEWAPAEGMRTVAGQLAEIIDVEARLVPRLKEGKDISDADVDEIVVDWTTLESLRLALTNVRRITLDYLDSLSDSELEEEVSFGGAWFGSFWQPQLPRAELFLNISDHEYYHVGQLISYLWYRGDDPYKW